MNDDGIKQILSERLGALRQHRDLMQSEVCADTGIATSTLSLIENGKRLPSVGTLVAIADKLDCSIDYLVGRTVDDRLYHLDEGVRAMCQSRIGIQERVDAAMSALLALENIIANVPDSQ